MAASYPHTLYACPCSDLTPKAPQVSNRRVSGLVQSSSIVDSENHNFDPHNPRANYSLYPLEHLLFCDECATISCPRCWTEDSVTWYCPSCLFEVPSSGVKSDGNRCSRNCYNCPACTSPLAITVLPSPDGSDAAQEAYMLQCQYCEWSTADLGIRFSRPTKITEQLQKFRKSRTSKPAEVSTASTAASGGDDPFAALTAFYKQQLNESGDAQTPYGGSPYSSPANLARIMSIYGGLSHTALKKNREKPQPMREAGNVTEGLLTYTADSEDGSLSRLEEAAWEETTTQDQQQSAPVNNDARFADQLWPVATPLRTRRGKRCSTCRQIIARTDPKISNLRYRIRLLAMNFVPRLNMSPLQKLAPAPPQAAFRLRGDDPVQPLLQRHKTLQYVLTVRNPIFETVKITLATPGVTPGKVASRVTILCPSFTVGPAGDAWDEALGSSTTSSAVNDGGRKAALTSLTGDSSADRQPEAGKVWEQTRNSTSVVVEIVPGSLKPPPSIVPKTAQELANEELDDGDDILEVPVYVRAEWEAIVDEQVKLGNASDKEEKAAASGVTGEKVKRELAFWCVLGIGQIAA